MNLKSPKHAETANGILRFRTGCCIMQHCILFQHLFYIAIYLRFKELYIMLCLYFQHSIVINYLTQISYYADIVFFTSNGIVIEIK